MLKCQASNFAALRSMDKIMVHEKHIGSCNCPSDKRVKLNLEVCRNCGQMLLSEAQSSAIDNFQASSISEVRYKRCPELQKLCGSAVNAEQAALMGTPKEQRKYAFAKLASHDPRNFRIWQESAELGIPDGQYLFGQCLLNRGEAKKGLRWLRIAAFQEHQQAKRVLGDYLLGNRRPAEGLRLLQEAADAGDAYACERLAYRYGTGDGVPQSKHKYTFYFRLAVQSRHRTKKLTLDANKSKHTNGNGEQNM